MGKITEGEKEKHEIKIKRYGISWKTRYLCSGETKTRQERKSYALNFANIQAKLGVKNLLSGDYELQHPRNRRR
jgi:hypothetical protein